MWICSGCRRRIPWRVIQCRCGGFRGHAMAVVEREPEARGAGRGKRLVGGGLAVAALMGLGLSRSTSEAARTASVEATARPSLQAQLPAPERPPVPTPAVREAIPSQDSGSRDLAFTDSIDLDRASRRRAPVARTTPAPEEQLSETDARRLVGLVALEQQYAAIASQAHRFVTLVKRFNATCAVGATREDCGSLHSAIQDAAVRVGAGIEQSEEICRKSWLEPGVVRELRERYGLDDSAWDELVSLAREYNR